MTFDITSHPLLSDKSVALSAPELSAHGRMAEQVLGLAGADLEGDDAGAAADAVVVQVNYQLEELPDRADGALIGESSLKWIEDNGAVSPLALRIAARLVGTGRKHPAVSIQVPETKAIDVGRKVFTTDDEQEPYGFEIT